MTFKEKVYQHYKEALDEKIALLQAVLADLKESGANETKSTAGDKHETALAMIQIEQANKRAQLDELLAQKAILNRIDATINASSVVNGSLLKTNRGWLYLAAALGKANIEGNAVMALSLKSPLGALLAGRTTRDTVSINNNNYLIESIY